MRFLRGQCLVGAIVEAFAWHGVAALFLLVYVVEHLAPARAAPSHLSLIASYWLGLVCLRFAVWRWLPNDRVARWCNAVILVSFLVALLGYYLAVIAGLYSWGRVISWQLISTYALQSGELLSTLGISAALVYTGFLAIVTGLVVLIARVMAPLDWLTPVARTMSASVAICVVAAGVLLTSFRIYAFAIDPPVDRGEPLSLTLFSEHPLRVRQGHSIGSAPRIDESEDAERERYAPGRDAVGRNLILIVGDALRSDHMSVYGYERKTTPSLDAMVVEGRLSKVDRMRAVCAESSCGLLAILRSKYVHQFSRRALTLQEVLRFHGYRIEMILGGDHTNFYGLRQAYGEVDSYFDGSSARGYYMNDDSFILERVAAMPEWDGKPTMLQFHLMSAHGLGTRHDSAQQFQPQSNYYRNAERILGRSQRPEPASTNFYDNGVIQFDRVVSGILKSLDLKGYLKDALVVITGDHGELLGEHGLFGHAKSVYEPVLSVPFIMLRFGYVPDESIANDVLASQVDIAPTVLREFGMPIPATWAGRALQAADSRDFIYFQQGAEVGLFDLRAPGRVFKYWIDVRTGEEWAFDVTGANDETENSIERSTPSLRREWRRETLPGAAAVVDWN